MSDILEMISDQVALDKAYCILSSLFLDIEPTQHDIDYIAYSLHELDASPADIDHIVYYDLFPILHGNLLNISGIWTGLDEVWLLNQIKSWKEQKRTWFTASYNYMAWLLFGWMVTSSLNNVKSRLKQIDH